MVGGHAWEAAEENKEEDSMSNDAIESAVLEEIGRTVVDVPMREQRSLATVTAEIRTIRAARDKMFLEASVEIGRRLKEAKELVGHGGWGDYCKTELDFSQQTAQNHIRLFEAYAADQIRLDGAALKSKTLGNLSYTQALELLALPSEEEREAFVREHDVASLSTRELREELRRRTGADPSTGLEAGPPPLQAGEVSAGDADSSAALRSAQNDRTGDGTAQRQSLEEIEAERELRMELIRANSRARDAEAERDRILRETEESRQRLDAAKAERDAARKAAEEAEQRAKNTAEDLKKAKEAMQKALDAKRKAQDELRAARENKSVPAETLEKLRREAEEAARKALEAEGGGKSVQEAEHRYVQAEKEALEARQAKEAADKQCVALQDRLEAAEKALRMAGPEMAAFQARFEGAQEALNKAVDALWALPPDKVDGGVRALRALLDQLGKRLEEERYEAAMPE